MDKFARRADDDRLAFINEAAARRDVTPIIIEKDFWVCWTLRRLMEVPVLRDHLTFKGGTSLSKAYGIGFEALERSKHLVWLDLR